jgi:hypothetical protein
VTLRSSSASVCQQPVELSRRDGLRGAGHARREGFQEGAQALVVEPHRLDDDGRDGILMPGGQDRVQLRVEVLGKWATRPAG